MAASFSVLYKLFSYHFQLKLFSKMTNVETKQLFINFDFF